MKKNSYGESFIPYRGFKKILLKMKITIILLALTLISAKASVYSQNTHLNIEANQKSIREVLKQIETQSDLRFFYNEEFADLNRKVDLAFKEEKLDNILNSLFDNSGLSFRIFEDNVVVITPVGDELLQETKVTGKVIDATTGEPLPGVYVVIEGTNTGTITNSDGSYSLDVPEVDAVLVFSFVGYNAEKVAVAGKSKIDLAMIADIKSLDAVVVIGYGTVKKSDLTGSISSVSKEDMGDRLVSDLGSLIQGKASGVDVSQDKIRIRGITSFNESSPLIVIDGFAGGNLSAVNVNDIENIEILKDASSTAIYGTLGANGVILITTKGGKKGPMKFNMGYKEGIAQVPRKLDLMNADQYTDYTLEMLENSGIAPSATLLSGYTRVDRTDWQDEVFKTGHLRELNLDFSGGSENGNYFLGLGYRHSENPTFKGMENDDIFIRSKNDFTIKRWLRTGTNLALSYNNHKGGGEYGNPGNLDHTINTPTYIPVKDEDGNYSISDRNEEFLQIANPITTAVHNHVLGSGIDYQVAFWSEVEPLKGLVYRVQASVSGDYSKDQTSNDSYTGGVAGESMLPTRIRKTIQYGISPVIEQYLTYKNILGKHDFSVMAGNSWRSGSNGGTIQIFGEGLDLAVTSVKTAPTNNVIRDEIWKGSLLSYFGRMNYQFNNKYLLTLNIRTDASPKFAPSNRWGTFPSVALAWKMHEEGFIKNLNIFDQLKLRAGMGTSGNDNIGDFRYLSQVYTLDVYTPFGNGIRYNGATVINNSSSGIRWETTETKTIGADMAFLGNSLTLSAEYYNKETRDILYGIPQPTSLGYGHAESTGSAIVNAASMENKGFEVQLGYRASVGDLNYSVNANYSHNKNKVISLGKGSYIDGINRTDIGNPIGYFYGYVADGLFMTQAELDAANTAAQAKSFPFYQDGTTRAGDVRFKDLNSDGHVDDKDRTYIGTPHPTHIYGLNLNLEYKGFDFNVILHGIGGSDIYDGNYDRVRGGQHILNQFTYVLDHWKSESEPGNGMVPRVAIGDPARNNRVSTLKLTNGNYLKIRQLSLGYSLSKDFCERIGFYNIRIYASADNYFTFSKWKYGYDPEVGGDNLYRGIDGGNHWPKPKLLMFGVQVQL